jgi:hypothetical protein
MKKLLAILIIAASVAFFTSCNESTESATTTSDSLNMDGSTTETSTAAGTTTTSYVDLQTGGTVTRNESGVFVNATGDPVEFYIDMNTMDTFFGRTNQNVNNALIHEGDDWEVDEAKIKIDEDEMKVKNPDGSKIKVDGDETKVKNADGSKTKTEDGETKIKR